LERLNREEMATASVTCNVAGLVTAMRVKMRPLLSHYRFNTQAKFGLASQPEVTVIVSGLGEVHDHELLGVFLLSSTNANGDTPLSDGWEILSDGHGGTGNYVEMTSIAGSDSIEHTWVLRTEDLGPKNMYASIHHGDSAGPSQGQPFFGISEGYEVEVAPLPENAPRLSAAFDPASTREVGVAIQVSIQTEHTQTVNVEWRAEDGAMMEATVNATGEDEWAFTLPASLKPSSVQWRATLIGEGPEQTTPWFTMVAQTAPIEADSGPIYLQGLAMALLLFGAVIALQKPQRREERHHQGVRQHRTHRINSIHGSRRCSSSATGRWFAPRLDR
jgi:hypothetical protein